MKNKLKLIMIVTAFNLSCGCSTITKSTTLGFGTGAAIGAATGALLDKENSSQSALNTALIFGVIGGIAGYLTHEGLETRDADVRKETLFNLEKYGVSGVSSSRKNNYQTFEFESSKESK